MYNKINYDSIYLEYANKTLDWLPSDTEKKYNYNITHNYEKLQEMGWVDKQITYSFNEYGFRCPSFSDDPSILFLGCSLTTGIGLPLENTWPYIVSAELKLNLINLGQGGGSGDTVFRLAHGWIPRLKPKIVYVLMPHEDRNEIVSVREKTVFLLPSQLKEGHLPKKWEEYYSDWLLEPTNMNIAAIKNRLALKQLCLQNNCKFVFSSVHELIFVDLARDLGHPGIETNKNIAAMALDKINKE